MTISSEALTATVKNTNSDDGGIGCDPTDPDSCVVQVHPDPIALNNAEFGGISIPFVTNHCDSMVEMLQVALDASLKDFDGKESMISHSLLNLVVERLDAVFTPVFLGMPGTTARNLSGGASGPPPPFKGSEGFKDEYQDSIHPGEDQTHHFAAFFSAGINKTGLSATAQMYTDDLRNKGDRELGDAAFALGGSLNSRRVTTGTQINRNNPRATFPETTYTDEPVSERLKRVLGIANAVRSQICD